MISPLAFIEGIGGPELMMILFIVLLMFGANKLPELARGFGKSVREFKKAAADVEHSFKEAMHEQPEPSAEAKRFAPKPVLPPAAPPRTFPPYPPGAQRPAPTMPPIDPKPNLLPPRPPAPPTRPPAPPPETPPA